MKEKNPLEHVKRYEETTGKPIESVEGKYIISGAAGGYEQNKHTRIFETKDRAVTNEVINEQQEYERELSEKKKEFAEACVQRAENLLAHFPASRGYLFFVERKGDNMFFAQKDLLLSDSSGNRFFEQRAFSQPDDPNNAIADIKFYPTDAPQLLHIITKKLQERPFTDFYDHYLTGENDDNFLRANPERIAFLKKAQAAGYNVGDLSYLQKTIERANRRPE